MSGITPWWFQVQAVDAIFDYFAAKTGNPLVALPGGTGKSVVIALCVKRMLQMYSGTRILVLTHVKELIEQNAERCQMAWPEAPIGIYSAGLSQRDIAMPLIFGGIASVYPIIEQFGWRDIIFIDEAHLLSQDENSMYYKSIEAIKKVNPLVKVVGLTATPYRLGQGKLTDDGLFTDVCYDMTNLASFNRLVDEGFIVPPTNKKTDVEIDSSELHLRGGEYITSELTTAVNKITEKACQELVYRAADRVSWLVFVPGVENAENIAALLKQYGIAAEAVHSKLKPKKLRDERIAAFKEFKLRCLVVNNMLTTGFDHRAVDCIAVLRKTTSPGLWVQILSRGTRLSPETGKTNCLVLDFARNTPNLGPINDPRIPNKKGGGGGDMPVRICEVCGTYNHASKRECECCGFAFDFSPKITDKAATEEIIRSDLPVIENVAIRSVLYTSHTKKGGHIPCMKVTYLTGFQQFHEYVHLEQPYGSLVGKQARDWWRERHATEPPATVQEALAYQSSLRVPKRINVHVNTKYPTITSYEY